ncbi:acyl-binding protein family [Pleomassaria siparia CBS 279.74]|uniref:Acyl-binding protein family n=1 Tax=Pleomassaria siparia CBS 279.74 TaxID=1314801 RepID=A0A6G1JYG8_9PLEO|nr:acyl-binding protein family [Pleomassaria siparia CBS 279.74]
MVSAKFTQIYNETREIKSGPSNDEQLDLYAFAKIAQGADINAAPKPGVFDLKGKATRKAWQTYVDEGVSAQDAEARYIALGEKLIAAHKK